MKLIATVAAAALVAGVLAAPAVAADSNETEAGSGKASAAKDAASSIMAAGVIVKRDGEISAETSRGAAAAALGAGSVKIRPVMADIASYDVAKPITLGEAQAAADQIAKQPGVEWAVPNTIQHAMSVWPNPINDAINGVNSMGRLHNIWDVRDATTPAIAARGITPWPTGGYGVKANTVWGSTTGAGVTVAVIDTGIRGNHPDLAGQILPGADLIADPLYSNDGDGRDVDASDPGDFVAAGECGIGSTASPSTWHGTHVAGTIAAVANNGIGVAGIAPGAKILPVRVLGKCGGTRADIAAGMFWAAGGEVPSLPVNPNPAQILNLSLGGFATTCDPLYQEVIDAVRGTGVSIIVAAGNERGPASVATPANCDGVITVAATSPYGDRAEYSNSGPEVDIAAPGGEQSEADGSNPDSSQGIWSTLDSGTTVPQAPNYEPEQGTSMAAPAASGVAALLYSLSPMGPDAMESALRATTIPFPTSATAFRGYEACTTATCGAGSLDLTKLPIPLTGPVVTGTPKAGQTLTATVGTWGGAPTTPSVTWLANGKPVAEGLTYRVGKKAVKKTLVAFAHGGPGYEGYGKASTGLSIPKAKARVKIKGKKRVRPGRKPVYRVKVKVPGFSRSQVKGNVKVKLKRRGRGVVDRATLRVRRGKVGIQLRGLRRGTYTLQVKFKATNLIKGDGGKKKIRVRR